MGTKSTSVCLSGNSISFLNSYLSMDQEDFPYIYKRLSNIFVTEYEKVLRIQKYNINSEYLHNIIVD